VRILFVSDNFPPERNAPATRVHEHACYWAKWGHEVTILTGVPNFPEGKVFSGYRNRWRQEEWIDGIRVVRVKTFITANEGTLLRTLDYLSFMASAFIAGAFLPKPDVVIATSPQFFAAVAGCGLSGLFGRPYLLEVRDLWPASIAAVGALKETILLRWLERIELFLYRKASAIVVVTNAFKEDLVRRGVPPGKIAVVINGVDLPRYAPRPRDPELEAKLDLAGRFVVGYVGTHGMAHALDKVLDVAGRMREAAGIRFLFVGGGAEKAKLVEEAERRGLTNVVFLPPQPKERMPEIWSLCDVALVHLKNSPVFASVIPSKIFEAMGMGLPIVIASPKGEAGGIVEEDGAGIWIPPEDPTALEGAVRRLKDDSDLYERCAAGSLAAAPRYSRERKAQEMIRVAERVAGGHGAAVDVGAPE
jgi:glycosyltransferase involved in cell wall biosynthesis